MPIELRDAAAAAYEQVEPLAAGEDVLATFVAALNGPIEDVAEWVSDTDTTPGYSVLLDVETTPAIALRWLGQMKGVRVTAGISEDAQRAEIRAAKGLYRGSAQALIDAALPTLTGDDPPVRVLTRVGGDMYAVTVITRTAETPDPAATLAALMAAKRIGVILTHVVSDYPIIDDITLPIDSLTESIDSFTLAGVT